MLRHTEQPAEHTAAVRSNGNWFPALTACSSPLGFPSPEVPHCTLLLPRYAADGAATFAVCSAVRKLHQREDQSLDTYTDCDWDEGRTSGMEWSSLLAQREDTTGNTPDVEFRWWTKTPVKQGAVLYVYISTRSSCINILYGE